MVQNFFKIIPAFWVFSFSFLGLLIFIVEFL